MQGGLPACLPSVLSSVGTAEEEALAKECPGEPLVSKGKVRRGSRQAFPIRFS